MFYEGLHLYQKTGVNTARTLYISLTIVAYMNKLIVWLVQQCPKTI